MNAPVLDAHALRLGEPDMAVDATAGVPAGVRLIAVIDTYGNNIIACTEITCNLVFKRTVAIRAVAHLLTVDIDRGVHIDTVELQEVTAHLADTEMLAVPPHPARQRTASGTTGVAGREVALNGPVMRQV